MYLSRQAANNIHRGSNNQALGGEAAQPGSNSPSMGKDWWPNPPQTQHAGTYPLVRAPDLDPNTYQLYTENKIRAHRTEGPIPGAHRKNKALGVQFSGSSYARSCSLLVVRIALIRLHTTCWQISSLLWRPNSCRLHLEVCFEVDDTKIVSGIWDHDVGD